MSLYINVSQFIINPSDDTIELSLIYYLLFILVVALIFLYQIWIWIINDKRSI